MTEITSRCAGSYTNVHGEFGRVINQECIGCQRRAPGDPDESVMHRKESDAVKARLAALEKQEPVAWLVYAKGSHRYCALTFDTNKVPDIYAGGDVIALYTAPGAAMNGGNHERS